MVSLRETRSQDVSLNALLDGIDTGQVVLPNFQRDFEWSDGDIRALLGTVLNGWPMGSLLLIEGDNHKEFYSPRSVIGAPAVAESVIYIILDGQQRLTSLYQALLGKGESVFAVKLDEKTDYSDVDALDEAIVTVPREVWNRSIRKIKGFEGVLLPFTALRDASAFYEWRDSAGLDPDFAAWVTHTYRKHLDGINAYRLPAVIVDSQIPPNAVARVFERVNRTGMKLGAFDLMVAKSYSPRFNLRASWEQAQEEHPELGRMLKKDGLPILTAIALREAADVRQSAVLDLSRRQIEEHWPQAVRHYAAAVHFAMNELGVRDPDWVPYRQILTVLAALDYAHPLARIRDELHKWFWSTGFGRRYDAASNTRAVADYRDLLARKDPSRSPLVLVRESAMEATRGQQGAWHRTYLCALGVDVMHRNAGTAPEGLVARSVYGRGVSDFDPPLHLRTLTFALWISSVDEPAGGLGATPTMAPSPGVLEGQLVKLQRFLTAELGKTVAIVSAEDEDVRASMLEEIVTGE